jgi:hypothetical protein
MREGIGEVIAAMAAESNNIANPALVFTPILSHMYFYVHYHILSFPLDVLISLFKLFSGLFVVFPASALVLLCPQW